jgi:nitrogenase molybdenum-iron protein NifN
VKAARAPRPSAASVATQNACAVCMPLGACLAYRGIAGAMPYLHGPQGCATYIRRFLIGHFREPMDIACSSFSETSAVFGGGRDLHRGLENVTTQYAPALVGVATTCLAETIGDDMAMLIRQYAKAHGDGGPELVWAATPSYNGTHADGFHAAVHGVVRQIAGKDTGLAAVSSSSVNLFPNMLSPADLRHLREIVEDFDLACTLLPDYSETLDRPVLAEYERIPEGGTPLSAVRGMHGARASVLLGRCVRPDHDAALYLSDTHGVPAFRLGIPVGIGETDRFFRVLEQLSGHPSPDKHLKERGRLVDAYVDGHKYLFGKRVALVGEEDLVIGLAVFVAETGAVPVVCATGGRSGRFAQALEEALGGLAQPPETVDGADFSMIEALVAEADADLILGSSRCYPMAAREGVPLIRVGMPIHDRIGAQRVLHTGYRGAQTLYDLMANTLIQREQDRGDAGYMTM